MKIRLFTIAFFLLLFSKQDVIGQTTHEVGVIAGPVALFSDYGVRADWETNTGNTGVGVGLIHYLKFCYFCGRNSWFNNHFMVRSELLYHKTDLKHYGRWVAPDKTGRFANQLRAMYGSSTVVEVGSQLEYYFFNIRDFNAGGHKVHPYIGLGVRWVMYNPSNGSELGPLNTEASTPPKYYNAFRDGKGYTMSVVGTIGTRYKLTRRSDLLIEARWHYYASDWVDGLNPSFELNEMVNVPENKYNDWLYWLAAGYIFYLE